MTTQFDFNSLTEGITNPSLILEERKKELRYELAVVFAESNFDKYLYDEMTEAEMNYLIELQNDFLKQLQS